MSADIMDWLARAGLAFTLTVLLVLALRLIWRRAFGARAVMTLWTLVPLGLVTSALPPPIEWVRMETSAASTTGVTRSAELAFARDIEPLLSTSDALATLWLSGALLFAFGLWRQQRRFLRSLGRLSHSRDNIYFSSNIAQGPALLGLHRPRIVLPPDFLQRYSAQQQSLILAHEYAHMQRCDLWVNVFVSAMRIVFWFHPLSHVGARFLRLDQELACDEAVIQRSPQARADYAAAILNTQLTDLGLPVGCFWQSSQPIRTRIVMIRNSNARRLPRKLGYAIGLTLAAMGLPLAWAAQPAQVRMVSLDLPTPATRAIPLPTVARGLLAAVDAPIRDPIATSQVSRRALPLLASPLSLESAAADESRPPLTLAWVQEATGESSPPGTALTDWAPPKLVKAQLPKWPSFRWSNPRTTVGAQVLVRATIDTDGRPTQIEVVQSSDRRFNPYAIWAVEKFRYEPARHAGKAVPSHVEVPLVWDPRERVVFQALEPPVGPPKIRYPKKDLY